jgi:hypothetical protein
MDFPRSAERADAGWALHSSSAVRTYEDFLGWQNWPAAGGHTYEIRFTARGGRAIFRNARGESSVRGAPFEVWELGADLSSPSDDVRYVPVIYDIDENGAFGLWSQDRSGENYTRDHPAFPGDADYWTDMIHIVAPLDLSAGEAGYQAAVHDSAGALGVQHLQWLAFVGLPGARGERPPSGARYRIALSREAAPMPARPVPAALNRRDRPGVQP